VCARLKLEDRTDEVSFLAPQLEKTAAMGLRNGVASQAHVEQDTALFEQSGRGMSGEVLFEDFYEFSGRY
jgi:hypothetical protein